MNSLEQMIRHELNEVQGSYVTTELTYLSARYVLDCHKVTSLADDTDPRSKRILIASLCWEKENWDVQNYRDFESDVLEYDIAYFQDTFGDLDVTGAWVDASPVFAATVLLNGTAEDFRAIECSDTSSSPSINALYSAATVHDEYADVILAESAILVGDWTAEELRHVRYCTLDY